MTCYPKCRVKASIVVLCRLSDVHPRGSPLVDSYHRNTSQLVSEIVPDSLLSTHEGKRTNITSLSFINANV